jgi:hypothetical protein
MERIVWAVLVVAYALSVWRLYADGWGRPEADPPHVMRVIAGGRRDPAMRPVSAPLETERKRTWS